MLIDSHCHLDMLLKDSSLSKRKQLEVIIKNANEKKIGKFLTISVNLDRFDNILDIANYNDNIFCSFGIHPCYVADEKKFTNFADIIKICNGSEKIVAVGETGIDMFHSADSFEIQKKSFLEHIIAARKLGLPVIIHTRNADNETIDILEKEYKKGEFKAVIHCFSCSYDFAKRVLDLGFYISFSGILTYKNADDLRKIAKNIPLNRLLVETDSPYLSPVPYRGKICEPAYVYYTAEVLAQVKEMSFNDIATVTTNNFFDLFSKAVK